MWVRRSDFRIDGNLKGFDYTRALERVKAPALVVIGDRDIVSPETAAVYTANDRRVIEIHRAIWKPVLHGFILRSRPEASAKKYAAIWTPDGSPLLVWSRRQAQVLHLVAQGMSNREVAEELFISENTVKNHVRNILEKLHLHSRMEAVVYAVREKLLDIH